MKYATSSFLVIDYGSKLAGTTVIAQPLASRAVDLQQSIPKKDADRFILDYCSTLSATTIFIDAPLSLPGKYRFPDQYQDFFYRQADRELKAMSPMFLGGLTARAMKLCESLRLQGHQVFEVYPAALARQLQLADWQYKKKKSDLPAFLQHFSTLLPFSIDSQAISNWHQVDALLALYSGHRFHSGEHQTFGNSAEGQILV